MSEWIVQRFPPHQVYVEVFGGAMGVLLNKPQSALEVYNDVDQHLVTFWRVVRDPDAFDRLYQRLQMTPYSRGEWKWSREALEATDDPVERAARWWVRVCQTFSADHVGGWSYDVRPGRAAVRTYLSRIESLPAVHERLREVQIENDDWHAIIDRYDAPAALFYLDPPYVHDARSRPDHGYLHEMDDAAHRALIARLLTIQGQCVLSGYAHPIYDALTDAGWERFEREVLASSSPSGRTRATAQTDAKRRTEVLWVRATIDPLPMFAELLAS